ncbi:hypothetical protein [Maribellus maritimus]|uniref:hypothetical protein n=1 Tax=Maribellus maritimus TaxID=2870838 RepID=UPI001EEBB7CC|nr:hypothetical protein [Maribellus maritimus]MCG6190512.1 hypothetical protein [Maribellus maritimus]
MHERNNFSSDSDTLYLESVKLKGDGIFKIGASGASFRDTSEWKNLDWFEYYPNYHFVLPDSVTDLKLGFYFLMFDSLKYFDESKQEVFYQQNYSLADRQILMIKGNIHNKEILIVDDNNNKDLRDDSIRQIKEWDWKSDENLIDIKYQIDYGNTIVKDTGWLKIGIFRNSLLESTSQHLQSHFEIDNKSYLINVADDNSSTFCFLDPIMYLVSDNGIARDTLIFRDIVAQGEYIKLGQFYYKFQKLYNGSGTIVLTEEKNFEKLTGTQVGMIAPEFTCQTVSGDTIESSNLQDKSIIILNSCGCGGDRFSTQAYYDIREKYSNDTYVIRLDFGIDKNLEGFQIDTEEKYNEDIYQKYRDAYCSRICYMINKEGRIEDKFNVSDWEVSLSKYFD